MRHQHVVDHENIPALPGEGYFGFGVGGAEGRPQFSHGGRNEGFDATLIGYANSGDGVVIMMNRNDNSGMTGRIIHLIFRRYDLPTSRLRSRR